MSARHTMKTTEFGNIWDAADPGHMHEWMGNLWIAWVAWAFVLEEAEVLLGEREVHKDLPKGEVLMPMLLAVRAMLLGFALECSLKALWVRKGNKLIRDGKYKGVAGAQDHNLLQLAGAAGFTPTTAEADVLRRLSNFVRFAGRYPVAKTTDEMRPDHLTQADVGFFSRKEFRLAESILNKVVAAVSGKKRRGFPRRLLRAR